MLRLLLALLIDEDPSSREVVALFFHGFIALAPLKPDFLPREMPRHSYE
jgi:hypothetical protein